MPTAPPGCRSDVLAAPKASAISAVASELPSSGEPVDILLASPEPSWRVVRYSLLAGMAAMFRDIEWPL